mgnify:CR=1 FL=1
MTREQQLQDTLKKARETFSIEELELFFKQPLTKKPEKKVNDYKPYVKEEKK